jgi:hypothetical protein
MKCDKPACFPEFYWKMLENWFEVKEISQADYSLFDVRRQTLWLNKNIKVNDKNFVVTYGIPVV